MTSIISHIVKHNNDYSKLSTKYFSAGYGDLVDNPYKSYKYCYTGNPVSISIIIPAYNAHKTIIQCLKSIEMNSYTIKYPNKIQVIVVDDGSLDNTYETVMDKSFSMQVQIVKQTNGYRASALNTALSYAKNNCIITCDSDMFLDSMCIEEIAKRYQILGKDALFVGFRQNTTERDTAALAKKQAKFWKDNRFLFDFHLLYPKNMFADTDKFKLLGNYKKIFINSKNGINRGTWTLDRMVYGALFACDRDLFDTTGGYDERFKGWGWEDTSMGAMAIAMGKYIIPVPSVCAFHFKHPFDIKAMKSTHNYKIYQDIIAKKLPAKSRFMSNARTKIIEQKLLPIVKKQPILGTKQSYKNMDYWFFQGEYDKIINTKLKSAEKHKPQSLFMVGQYDLLIKKHKKSIEACFALILKGDYNQAMQLYASQNIIKDYLSTIDTKKLIETAELWRKQGSFLFAFINFSLYSLHNGFTKQLIASIRTCSRYIEKGNKF